MKDAHRPKIEMLTEDNVQRIIGEALRALAEIGVFVENDEAIDLLVSSGATVSDDKKRVFIPEQLVLKCTKTVPSSYSLYDRTGEEVAKIGGDNILFDPGSAAIYVYDYAAKKIRKPDTKDVVEFVITSNALPSFKAQSTGVVPADVPEDLADRYRLFLALIYGTKPVVTGTFTKEAFPAMLSFLTSVRGGGDALRAKPLAIFDCCPSPPLMWSDLTCQALMDCAKNGIPAELVSMPLTGATSPVTLAGALVQHTAEDLSGIVIHQLACPGAPINYGGSPACFDMRKGTTPMGAVETMMIDVAYGQIGKSFGFPVHAYMALSDAKTPDYQGGFETAMGATLAALAGINVISGPGMLNFESCQSLEKLVIDNEVCAMAQRLIEGIAFREEVVGFDILREFADSKMFLTSEHTRKYFRQETYYPSDVIDRATHGEWEKLGSLSAADRAHARVRTLLDDTQPALLDDALIGELEARMLVDAKAYGLDTLPDWRVLCR
ncbi:MAG: trimethylamine methyltransferase family protein [Candidatus Latescibacterota bacterium]